MKVSFAGQPLLEIEKTGIGYYTEGLIQSIMKRHREDNYCINVFSYRKPQGEVNKSLEVYSAYGAKVQICKKFPLKIYKLIWKFIPIPYKWIFRNETDVTHFFNYHIPPFVKGKTVCTVHDMTIKAYPETVRLSSRFMMHLNLKSTCKRADKIITSSEFSKKEIMKYMNVSADKICVLYSGVDLNVYQPCTDVERISFIKKKYGVVGEYFLYLGTLEPRKNIERLIKAYALATKKINNVPKLVIAGRKGWMYKEIFQTVEQEKLTESVIFTGYIEKEEAPILLSGAMAFLFPSLYEGFGMPPLEAMACGTPVITSNCASLPEVVGDAALLVNPYSVEEISHAMKTICEEQNLRNNLAVAGRKRALLFTWDKLGEQLYQIYKEVVES